MNLRQNVLLGFLVVVLTCGVSIVKCEPAPPGPFISAAVAISSPDVSTNNSPHSNDLSLLLPGSVKEDEVSQDLLASTGGRLTRDAITVNPTLLVLGIDGTIQALNRDDGTPLWRTRKSVGEGSVVGGGDDETEEHHFDLDGEDDDLKSATYILSPSSGELWVHYPPSSPQHQPKLERLPLTLPDIVIQSFSPERARRVQLSSSDNVFFTGKIEETVFGINLEDGKIIGEFGDKKPGAGDNKKSVRRATVGDMSEEEAATQRMLDELEGLGSSQRRKARKKRRRPTDDEDEDEDDGGECPEDLLYILRTDYVLTIHTLPSAGSYSRRPKRKILRYSSFTPPVHPPQGFTEVWDDLDGNGEKFHVINVDKPDPTLRDGGGIFCLDKNSPRDPLWLVWLSSKAGPEFTPVKVFDVLHIPNPSSPPFIHPQPWPTDLLGLVPSRTKSSDDLTLAFVDTVPPSPRQKSTKKGALWIMSADQYPFLSLLSRSRSSEPGSVIGWYEVAPPPPLSLPSTPKGPLEIGPGSNKDSSNETSAPGSPGNQSTPTLLPGHLGGLLSLTSGPGISAWIALCALSITAAWWKLKSSASSTTTMSPIQISNFKRRKSDLEAEKLRITKEEEQMYPPKQTTSSILSSIGDKPLPSLPSVEDGEDDDGPDGVASGRKKKRRPKNRGKNKKGKQDDEEEDSELIFVETGPNGVEIEKKKLTKVGGSGLCVSEELLGVGSHGTMVFSGTWQSRPVAVKRLLRHFTTIASHEISLLQSTDMHPNVVRYFCQEKHDNWLYIAIQLCPASLADVIEKPAEEGMQELAGMFEPKRAIRDIARGIKFLHGLGIVHRDIKPQNILVTQDHGSLKMLISDFGLAKRIQPDQSSFGATTHAGGGAGSPGWRAPEVLLGHIKIDAPLQESTESSTNDSEGGIVMVMSPSKDDDVKKVGTARMTRAVDIFSFGCLAYWILTSGSHPFGERYEREGNICHGKYSLSSLDPLGEEGQEAADLVSGMISHEGKDRPIMNDIIIHPYFWDAARRLAFLQDASDRFEILERTPPDPTLVILEARAREVVSSDWIAKLDKTFVENLGKYRKYDVTSVRDLLRALRNKKHHYQDLPPNARKAMGAIPSGFLAYFTRRFPKLFLHVYGVVRDGRFRNEQEFKGYFTVEDT